MSEEPAPTKIGDYDIEALLGEGGMAKVYRAKHAFLETVHAIKVLDPSYRVNAEARKRFLDEAKIQAKHLDHDNIVKVTNIVATAEHAALVMELIEGSGLEGRIGDLRTKPAEIKHIILAVLDAVGHAHGAGIIHRDLKPANVLLHQEDGVIVPKVTDFGIAKVTATDNNAVKKSTHGGARMGTLAYSSPEQIRRAKDVTARSDVYSLGAMLYEMATGEMAFGGDSDYDVMENIVNGRFTPPEQRYPQIDPTHAAVIRKAMAKDPAERYASCAEMAAALRSASTPVVVVAAPTRVKLDPSVEQKMAAWNAPKSGGSKAPLVIGLGVAALALGGIAVYLGTRGGGEPVKPAPVVAGSGSDSTAPDPWKGSGAAVWDLARTEFPAGMESAPDAALTTASGLRYLVLRESGPGKHPTTGDVVTVEFNTWRLSDKGLVRTTHGQPRFEQAIDTQEGSMSEILRMMTPGGRMRVWTPAGPQHPAVLVDIELVSFRPAAPLPCAGTFKSDEDLTITLEGTTTGACGTYAFVDTSGVRGPMRCAGALTCEGHKAEFTCTYTKMASMKLAGTMDWTCADDVLAVDIKMGSGTRTWRLSRDSRPRP
ncbi:MAG: protein kinase [Deltaproteobacteria bacterium]|nr:protein kinase [Deltaproteobacteria bacterium]